MPQDDIELGNTRRKKNYSKDEVGSTKLWAVYIAEAEKYDKALVESWRSDMGGMLIFAGLFSGSLTAFIIESYRNLTPDSGDTTVLLLQQISAQLDGAAKGSYSTPPPQNTFTPPLAALLCNALWFMSLALSLTCALIATLVEQWARDFLHRADIRSAPLERARIFAYLYYGLKRFKMHAVVEVLPLLLHASLILFFAGLVAFLAAVNRAIMILARVLLGAVVTVYLVFTILPLICPDCPYRTPLSGALWRGFRIYGHGILRFLTSKTSPKISPREPGTKNMIGTISSCATEPSEERSTRDRRALVWTVKSLADDNALEAFVASIPDVLWGPNGKRHTYDEHIKALVRHSETRLLSRISDMLRRCESGVLPLPDKMRREISCYKAIWAICTLDDIQNRQQTDIMFDLPLIPSSSDGGLDVKQCMLSAVALIRWNVFRSFSVNIMRTTNLLAKYQGDLSNGRAPNLTPILALLREISQHPILGSHPFPSRQLCLDHLREVERTDSTESVATRHLIEGLFKSLQRLQADIPHIILFDYLYEVTKIGVTPYEFERTRDCIILEETSLSAHTLIFLERIFNAIVSNHLDSLRTMSGVHLLDKILGILSSFWRPQLTGNASMPRGLIEYLNHRGSDGAILHVAWHFGPNRLWSCMTTALENSRLSTILSVTRRVPIPLDEILMALWRLYSLPARIIPEFSICESLFDAVLNSPSAASPPVIALIKANILDALRTGDRMSTGTEDIPGRLSHPILSGETAHKLPVLVLASSSQIQVLKRTLNARIMEARVQIVAELLESCSSSETPYNAVKTLSLITPVAPSFAVHAIHQIRFAKSIQDVFHALGNSEVLEAALNLDAFDVYAPKHGPEKLPKTSGSPPFPWMDSDQARQIVRESLRDYEKILILSADSPVILSRVREILLGMESLHTRSVGSVFISERTEVAEGRISQVK